MSLPKFNISGLSNVVSMANDFIQNQSFMETPEVEKETKSLSDFKLPPINYEATQKDKTYLVVVIIGAVLLIYALFGNASKGRRIAKRMRSRMSNLRRMNRRRSPRTRRKMTRRKRR